MMITALVDADPIVYQAGFAVEKKTGKSTIVEPLPHALQATKKMIAVMQDSVRKYANSDDVAFEFYLTGPGNFREQIATIKPYKGNRDPLHKPYWYNEIRNYISDRFDATTTSGWEADDAVAMRQWNAEQYTTVICTLDKDLLMVPGLHYNYGKNYATIITPDAGMRNFYMQLLTGDPTDNIGGCYKVGKKKAQYILPDTAIEEDLYNAVRAAYRDSILAAKAVEIPGHPLGVIYGGKGPAEALLENARLLWMLQYPGQLWTPPGQDDEVMPGFEED